MADDGLTQATFAVDERDIGSLGDALNEFLFSTFNADTTKVVWLDTGRWLVSDCEEPGLYIVEMYPAKAVRDA